jgi:hypothetical protein
MENFDESHLGGVPERFRQEVVRAHYSELVRAGDMVEAICNVGKGIILCGTRAKITEVVVTPNLNGKRGFTKRIRLEGFEGDFNPQRFKKVKE